MSAATDPEIESTWSSLTREGNLIETLLPEAESIEREKVLQALRSCFDLGWYLRAKVALRRVPKADQQRLAVLAETRRIEIDLEPSFRAVGIEPGARYLDARSWPDLEVRLKREEVEVLLGALADAGEQTSTIYQDLMISWIRLYGLDKPQPKA